MRDVMKWVDELNGFGRNLLVQFAKIERKILRAAGRYRDNTKISAALEDAVTHHALMLLLAVDEGFTKVQFEPGRVERIATEIKEQLPKKQRRLVDRAKDLMWVFQEIKEKERMEATDEPEEVQD